MNQKQLTTISIIISLVTLVLVVELGKIHFNHSDVAWLLGFLAGAGVVIALYKTRE